MPAGYSKEKFPSYEEFRKIADGNKFEPVYLFFGDEDFLIDECVDYIISYTLLDDAKAFNLDVLHGSKSNIKEVLSVASSYPLNSDRRVVIVKEFEKLVSDENGKTMFSSYLAKPLKSTCLILIADNPDFRTKPFNELKKLGCVYRFNSLYDNQIPKWIYERCKKRGKDIEIEACELIHAYVGNSLRVIQNELDKLFAYVGEKKKITTEDAIDLVGFTRGYTIFDLQKAIGIGDINKALHILKRMLEKGEQPQLILVMLTRYFTIIWKIKELSSKNLNKDELPSLIQVSPYYVDDYLEVAKKIDINKFDSIFNSLLEADLKLKTTSIDHKNMLEMLIHSLTNISR